MVKAADDEAVVIKQFMDFYGNDPLCGHNVQFDVGFVDAALKRCGYPGNQPAVVDTLECFPPPAPGTVPSHPGFALPQVQCGPGAPPPGQPGR